MAPDLGPLCSIGGYSFCEAAQVAERIGGAIGGFIHSLPAMARVSARIAAPREQLLNKICAFKPIYRALPRL
jgi:hypothetical protein